MNRLLLTLAITPPWAACSPPTLPPLRYFLQ